jgi:UTP--glucose-1-phosphate uridylyltransferase
LRSDACEITDDWRIMLSPELHGRPPAVDLDGDHYKLMDEFETRFAAVPSLKRCARLKVRGPVDFGPGIGFAGNVEVTNAQKEPKPLKAGVYENQAVAVS